jgi:hypothetical protein
MTDFDLRVRNAMNALADAEPVEIPPFASLQARPSIKTAPRRSRMLIAAIAVGALALAATAGGAVGILPIGVDRAFHRISGWGEVCRVDTNSAQLLASYRVPDGRVFQWWRAVGPRRTDGSFATGDDFRIVSRAGKARDQAWGCQTIASPPTKLVVGAMGDSPVGDVTWGQAPQGTTAAVRGVFGDGTSVAIPLQHGRYFMTAIPTADPRGPVVRIEASSADGRIIASEPNPLNAP